MEENKTQKRGKEGFLTKALGGDALLRIITDNIGLFALIVVYMVLYVSNRYAYQQELHTIAKLKREVKVLQYDVLTQQSVLSEKSRQSHIEKYVQESGSELGIATRPPFLIE